MATPKLKRCTSCDELVEWRSPSTFQCLPCLRGGALPNTAPSSQVSPPTATHTVRAQDVPTCPDCGGRQWLNDRCLSCPTGLMPRPPIKLLPTLRPPNTDTPPAPSEPLADVRTWLQDRLEQGVPCPCCDQLAKVYRRRVNSGMARGLIRFFQRHRTDWGHQPSVPGLARLGGEWARLTYWGLIEEAGEKRDDGGRAGWWRITEAGEAYLRGAQLPRYAHIYNGRCLNVDGEGVTISDALGAPFDLAALLEGRA